MDQQSFTLILQSFLSGGAGIECEGFVQVPLMQPTRLLLMGDIAAATNISRLFAAIEQAIAPLSSGGARACLGPGGVDCWATEEPAARNVLIIVAGDDPPTYATERSVDDYLSRGFEVYGVYKAGLRPENVLPQTIRTRLAVAWKDDVCEITGEIVDIAIMGIEDRRIFISYSRQDGSNTAERLAAILAGLRFDVFLDRFQIPPGADLVERISDELTDKAMVVVLETPGALASPWVWQEVITAISRRLGVAAVNLAQSPVLPAIGESARCRIDDDDALADFLLEQHRNQMGQRRHNLMQSVWRALSSTVGPAAVSPSANGFRVDAPPLQYEIAVCIRPATLNQFRLTHERAGNAKPVIIHPRPQRADRKRDAAWLSGVSEVADVDEGHIGLAAGKIARGQTL